MISGSNFYRLACSSSQVVKAEPYRPAHEYKPAFVPSAVVQDLEYHPMHILRRLLALPCQSHGSMSLLVVYLSAVAVSEIVHLGDQTISSDIVFKQHPSSR